MLRSTYTFAKLPVSAATFAEVADKLKRAGYMLLWSRTESR
jgi:L-amino acid N-acyltransferase YncA